MEEEKIELLFEAARIAPSSFNEQPWRFIYATKENPVLYNKLLDCLAEKKPDLGKNGTYTDAVYCQAYFYPQW